MGEASVLASRLVSVAAFNRKPRAFFACIRKNLVENPLKECRTEEQRTKL